MGSAGVVPDRREELLTRLHQGPGEEARQDVAVTPTTPVPSRWTLRTIRACLPWLQCYSLSGVWRVLRRYTLKRRSAQVQHYSPDPEYLAKVARLERCLELAASAPEQYVVVFMDEMGYTRWPEPAVTWAAPGRAARPVAQRAGTNNQQWRIIGDDVRVNSTLLHQQSFFEREFPEGLAPLRECITTRKVRKSHPQMFNRSLLLSG